METGNVFSFRGIWLGFIYTGHVAVKQELNALPLCDDEQSVWRFNTCMKPHACSSPKMAVHSEERRKRARKEAVISGKKSISESSKVSPSLKRQSQTLCQMMGGKRRLWGCGQRQEGYKCWVSWSEVVLELGVQEERLSTPKRHVFVCCLGLFMPKRDNTSPLCPFSSALQNQMFGSRICWHATQVTHIT